MNYITVALRVAHTISSDSESIFGSQAKYLLFSSFHKQWKAKTLRAKILCAGSWGQRESQQLTPAGCTEVQDTV